MTRVWDAIRERALSQPDAAALVSAGRGDTPDSVCSYADLERRVSDHADRLAKAGLSPGDRVGLHARQGAGFVEMALGVLAAGGCLVPIPDDHEGPVLDGFVGRARVQHLLRESDAFEVSPVSGARPLEGGAEHAFRALDPAYLRFTSGTTSERKGVVLGHATIMARLDAANRGLAIGPADRVMWLLPMAHHFVVSILLYLREGATILLPASSMARDVLALADRQSATVFYASPYHYNLLAKDTSSQRLDSVRLAISTAEGLRTDVAERFRERFGMAVLQALGIIEVGLSVMNLAHAAEKPGSLGRPLPDYDVWLRAEDGSRIAGPGAPDRTGEICIRGPGLLDAYLDPWLPAREILEPDGFRTGDQGWFDAEGDLFLAGRRANRINMAGMKFFSEEVEAVLERHPAIQASRVAAREHPHLGEIPVADVVLEPGAEAPDRKALAAFCKGQLPAYKIPRELRVVSRLDQTPTGKLRRSAP